MIAEAFLVAALSLPSAHFNRQPIISYHAIKSEEDSLKDWLRKNNPGADIFIHKMPQVEKLIEHHWERVPFTWRGNQIWIQRKPFHDKRGVKNVGTSA